MVHKRERGCGCVSGSEWVSISERECVNCDGLSLCGCLYACVCVCVFLFVVCLSLFVVFLSALTCTDTTDITCSTSMLCPFLSFLILPPSSFLFLPFYPPFSPPCLPHVAAVVWLLFFADLKLHLATTQYGNFLANEPSPLAVSTIDAKLKERLVSEFQHIRKQAVQPLAKFLDYISYGYMIDNIILLITGILHDRDIAEVWLFSRASLAGTPASMIGCVNLC